MKGKLIIFIIMSLNYCLTQGESEDEMKKRYKKEAHRFENLLKYDDDTEWDEVDAYFGPTTMRVYTKGGKVGLQRKGQFVKIRVKAVSETTGNDTKVQQEKVGQQVFNIIDIPDYTRYNTKSSYMTLHKVFEETNSLIRTEWVLFKNAYNVTGEDGNIYPLVDGGIKSGLKVSWGNPEARYLEVVLAIQCGHTGESRMQPEESSAGNRVMFSSEKQRYWGRDPFMKNRQAGKTYYICKNARMTFSNFYLSKGNELEIEDSYPKVKKLKLLKGETEIVLRFQGANINYDMTLETGDDIVDKQQSNNKRVFGLNTQTNEAMLAGMQLGSLNSQNDANVNEANKISQGNVRYICLQVLIVFMTMAIIIE
eukprot:TCONS_00025593-protein